MLTFTTDFIQESELGLNWKTYSTQEEIQSFLKQIRDPEAYVIELLEEQMQELKKTLFKRKISSRFAALKNVIQRLFSKLLGR